MGQCQKGEKHPGDDSWSHGDAPFRGRLDGPVNEVHTARKEQQHQHLRQSTERITPESFAKQHQDSTDCRDFCVEYSRDQQVIHTDCHQEKQGRYRRNDPIERENHFVGSHLPSIRTVCADQLEDGGVEQRVKR